MVYHKVLCIAFNDLDKKIKEELKLNNYEIFDNIDNIRNHNSKSGYVFCSC